MRRWLLLGFGLSGAGCGYVSGASELEIVDLPPLPEEWACLGEGAPLIQTEPIAFSAPVRNLATNRLVESVSARFCEGEPCIPVAEVEGVDGVLSFPPVEPEFRGYIELESPGMLPAVVELLHPIGAMRSLPELRLLSADALATYASSLGRTVDAGLGQALFWVRDCGGEPAPGVSLRALDGVLDNTRDYYVVDFKLPSDATDRTQNSGGGGFVNLEPGFPRFEARLAADGTTISRFVARVRPGTVTFFVVEPE
ncbi:MAG: hypothetical protein M3020_09385 [Myxococcota bacterium]|nr:hypothetical protein [Myxococcota bacterium]